MSVLGSVLIPAHNEATTIARGLDALLSGFEPQELEVVVVCNGCTDDTAQVARAAGYRVRVLEEKIASKAAALRVGDAVLTAFPRIYLDADVILPSSAARVVLDQLAAGTTLAARPPLQYETSKSTALVRAYYRARCRLPNVTTALWGAGTYGLSAAGRSRFTAYPDVTNDDLFVAQQFRAAEIDVVQSPPVIVVAPRSIRDLLAILRRTYQGNAENRDSAGERGVGPGGTFGALVRATVTNPRTLPDAGVYISVVVLARLSLRVRKSRGWERDDSSRNGLLDDRILSGAGKE